MPILQVREKPEGSAEMNSMAPITGQPSNHILTVIYKTMKALEPNMTCLA